MSLSTHIATCKNCMHHYCCECTDAETWQEFCSRSAKKKNGRRK